MAAPASFADATPCAICGHRSIVADCAAPPHLCERCSRAREFALSAELPPPQRLLRPVPWKGADAHPLAAEAVRRMGEGPQGAKNIAVSRAFLVANYDLEGAFGSCVDQMRRETKPTDTFRAFHGTDRRSAGAIARTGFDMRFAGRHGQAHGPGVYFSETAGYSTTFSKADARGAQCMFYTEVAAGRVGPFEAANPAKNDSAQSGGIRIAFRAQQTLPLVLVYFESGRA